MLYRTDYLFWKINRYIAEIRVNQFCFVALSLVGFIELHIVQYYIMQTHSLSLIIEQYALKGYFHTLLHANLSQVTFRMYRRSYHGHNM